MFILIHSKEIYMNIKEVMKLIKNDERFSNVFHFYGDDKSHIYDMLPTAKLRKKFSFVNWIYLTTLSQVALIGIIENNKVFTMDNEGDTFILCDSFFEIPFRIISTYLRKDNPKHYLHNNPNNKDYLENLKFYADWCKNNNIHIDEKYLEILKP